jgi:hypothetical protein
MPDVLGAAGLPRPEGVMMDSSSWMLTERLPNRRGSPLSRNNHAHLKDKSSAAQGLSVAIPASSAHRDPLIASDWRRP